MAVVRAGALDGPYFKSRRDPVDLDVGAARHAGTLLDAVSSSYRSLPGRLPVPRQRLGLGLPPGHVLRRLSRRPPTEAQDRAPDLSLCLRYSSSTSKFPAARPAGAAAARSDGAGPWDTELSRSRPRPTDIRREFECSAVSWCRRFSVAVAEEDFSFRHILGRPSLALVELTFATKTDDVSTRSAEAE